MTHTSRPILELLEDEFGFGMTGFSATDWESLGR